MSEDRSSIEQVTHLNLIISNLAHCFMGRLLVTQVAGFVGTWVLALPLTLVLPLALANGINFLVLKISFHLDVVVSCLGIFIIIIINS